MGQRAAAVEQAGQRVREQRAARRRTGDDIGLREKVGREHVEQILREPPDRRRMTEQLVRIEVDPAVKSVAVIEVPVAHQHLEILQRPERLPAQSVSSRLMPRFDECAVIPPRLHLMRLAR